jgi:methyl-accepting chemotaxis protein
VKGGSRLVSEAAERLAAMLVAVKENCAVMESISAASGEQSDAIAEVSTAVRQMDEMTQHNAALVEQTNAAIEQTEAQASELDQLVDVFVVDKPAAGRDAPHAGLTRRPAHTTYRTDGNAALAQRG